MKKKNNMNKKLIPSIFILAKFAILAVLFTYLSLHVPFVIGIFLILTSVVFAFMAIAEAVLISAGPETVMRIYKEMTEDEEDEEEMDD